MSAQPKLWLGLVFAPLLFLSNMQVSFILVPWVCGHGHGWLIHLAHATTIALIVSCSLPAWFGWRRAGSGQQFIALLSVAMGVFASVALLAHWIPNFLLGACE
jgi:hypothetical protein